MVDYVTILLLLSAPIMLVLVLDSILRGFYIIVRLLSGPNSRTVFCDNRSVEPAHPASRIPHPASRLGVLILARDEQSVIGDTVLHLSQLTYPRDRYQIMVVADNCQDATAAVARSAGAQVWERHQPDDTGKGAALRWFVTTARRGEAGRNEGSSAQEPALRHFDWAQCKPASPLQNFDAILILDADSRVSPEFLTQINDLLARGAQCIQGFLMPIPVIGSRASLLAAYSELLSQHIDATARWRLGWSAQLYGTGMAFRTELLTPLTARLRTKVEDVELTLAACTLTTPTFAPQAIVYDPKPASAGRVMTQRARWAQGQAAIWRTLWRDVLALIIQGSIGTRALVLSLLLKPKTLVLTVKVLVLGVLVGLAIMMRGGVTLVLTSALAVAVLIDLTYYLIGLVWIETPVLYAKALLVVPLYPLMWVWGIVTAVRSGDAWLRARDF